jgi:hypothetical protein
MVREKKTTTKKERYEKEIKIIHLPLLADYTNKIKELYDTMANINL